MNTVQAHTTFDLTRIRADFPTLDVEVHGKPLVYFDNGATAHKPLSVIQAVDTYYREQNSNVHRGVHFLSANGTFLYEKSRRLVREFINADRDHEVIITKGTTDGVNLVANGFARSILQPGDEILLTGMEHHSNIVPWQMAAEYTGATVKAIPVMDDGTLDLDAAERLLTDKTKILTLVHVSNTLGTINPVRELIRMAHERDIPVLLDGAQAVPHMKVDVRELDVDFYVFSMHKMFGPTGVGFLYGKEKWLEKLPPYQGGGDMISRVTLEKTTYNELPHKFEAGTPNIAGVIGSGLAVEYMQNLDYQGLHRHEADLLGYATQQLEEVNGLRIIGTAAAKASVLSFIVDGVHPSDLGTLLDMEGVAVRTGHHCTQPLMDRFGIPATVRASFAMYNSREEIDVFVKALHKALRMFA